MQDLVNRIKESRDFTHDYRGIILLSESLSEEEFNSLVPLLKGDSDSRICIIDSTLEKPVLNSKESIVLTPSIWTDLEISRDRKVNALRTVPNYIVFKNYISKDNIEDIYKCTFVGHNVICFSDLEESELTRLIGSEMGVDQAKSLIKSLGLR